MSSSLAQIADRSALDRALALVAANVEEAVDDLASAIAIDTSFPPGAGYARFAERLEALVAPLGFECRRVLVPSELWQVPDGPARGERVNLIASGFGGNVEGGSRHAQDGAGKQRPVCNLYFHTDTVPPAADWQRAPFALTREGNRLYGLGAADMKGTIAAALLALSCAKRCGIELAYDPVLLFCTDEEGGLYPGARYLAEQGLIRGHLLSFNGGAVPRIWAGCFGSINLLVRVHGRAAHAGDSTQGVNAIEAAIPVLAALAELKLEVGKRASALQPPPRLAGETLRPRLTIASAHGGASGGSVPALFEILINRRYAPEESFDDALAEIEAALRKVNAASEVKIETRIVGHLAPVADPTGPHWPRWQAALSQGFGWAASDFHKYGATSSSDLGFVQATGIKEILLGGLGRPDRNVHAAEEHTTIEDLVALARSILAYLAADFRPDILPEAQGRSP
jgi:succinyl-diaminopimelate desuccinylase